MGYTIARQGATPTSGQRQLSSPIGQNMPTGLVFPSSMDMGRRQKEYDAKMAKARENLTKYSFGGHSNKALQAFDSSVAKQREKIGKSYNKQDLRRGLYDAIAEGTQQAAPQAQQTQITLDRGQLDAQLAAQEQARQQQMGLAQMLQQQAAGTGGPTAAQMLLQQAQEQNANAIRSQVASQAGLSPGLAARLAAQGVEQSNLQSAQQAAILRAQEQQRAQGALGQLLTGVRGQDIGLAGQEGGLAAQIALAQGQMNQQTALSNVQNQLAQRGLAQGYLGMAGDLYTGEQQRGLQQLLQQNQLEASKEMAEGERKWNLYNTLIGGGLSAAGSIIGAAI